MSDRVMKAFARQSGLAIVEFVVVLPIMMVLMVAITELGRGLYQYNTLAKAVRDSARYLTVNIYDGDSTRPPSGAVINAANNLVVCGRLDCTSVNSLVPGFDATDVYAGTYGGGGTQDSDSGSLTCDNVRAGDSAEPLTVVVCAEYPFRPLFGDTLLGVSFTMRPTAFMGVL